MLVADRGKGTLLLTLDRPRKRNALHPDLIGALAAALARADGDDGVRAIVITGAGDAFCAGLDLGQLSELDEAGRVAYMRSAFSLFRQIHELRPPVLAAVNGAAMAGGFDLAAFCDMRFCAPGARFAQSEIHLGLTQIMYPLYTIVGLGRAMELALTGETIDADEAYRIGLVNRIWPGSELVARTLRMAETLAVRPPEALFETKRLSREIIELDTASAMERMFDTIAARLRSREHGEALGSYVARLESRRSGDGGSD